MSLFENPKLYFIAVIPNDKIQKEITAFKKLMAEKYFTKHALKSPPHITLIPPFKWDEKDEDHLIRLLNDFAATQLQFSLQFKDFASFKPRVIFVDIIKNEWLQHLYDNINDHFATIFDESADFRPQKSFAPHVTIGFRDLKKKMFYKAWDDFKEKKYSATFDVTFISLLRHNGKKWEVVHNAALQGKN